MEYRRLWERSWHTIEALSSLHWTGNTGISKGDPDCDESGSNTDHSVLGGGVAHCS